MPTITINISQQQLQQLLSNEEFVISLVSDTATVGEPSANYSFFTLISEQEQRLRQQGCIRTAETYNAALRQLQRFWASGDMKLSAVTADLMEQYQHFLRSRDLAMNTVSFYMRRLRAVYQRAVMQGLISDSHPFSHVYTGIAKTQKRALSVNDIRAIRRLQLDNHHLIFARDLFLFSFYTRGMSFVDMAYLDNSCLRDGILSYRRHKTGQQLRIRWEPCMQAIVDRHKLSTGKYLLPIICRSNGKERNQYRHRQSVVNKNLKEVGRLAGLTTGLTMYQARHSWATIASELQVPLGVISHALGHTNARTTEVYIRGVDSTMVDQTNQRIAMLIEE